MLNQFDQYSEDDAQEILKRAVSRQAQLGGFHSEHAALDAASGITSRQLEKMAAELGISPDVLHSVEQEYVLRREEERERQEFIRHRRMEFKEHLAAYVIVNTFLVLIDFLTEGHLGWSIWPILGWGIGLAFSAREALIAGGEDFEDDFEKWRAKREKRRAKRMKQQAG